VPQWLFAFDAAGIATFRAIALLSAHADQATIARAEIAASTEQPAPELPYVRACVLESVRLWPTTPMILRESTAETGWDEGTMPRGTGLLIFAPYFHRDATRLPFADRFTPEIWLHGAPERELGIVPFSDGPARCPGREIVLLLASTMLSTLMRDGVPRLARPHRLDAALPMPGTLDNYTLRFELVREAAAVRPEVHAMGHAGGDDR
jgi:cytochrome P450